MRNLFRAPVATGDYSLSACEFPFPISFLFIFSAYSLLFFSGGLRDTTNWRELCIVGVASLGLWWSSSRFDEALRSFDLGGRCNPNLLRGRRRFFCFFLSSSDQALLWAGRHRRAGGVGTYFSICLISRKHTFVVSTGELTIVVVFTDILLKMPSTLDGPQHSLPSMQARPPWLGVRSRSAL